MDKLKYIKLENEDGSYSNSIPLSVDSDHVDVGNNTLTQELERKDNIISSLATKVEMANVESKIDTQKTRIDNLAVLEEGSTTGDAELIDARIDKYGSNFSSLTKRLNSIEDMFEETFGKVYKLAPGYIKDNGSINAASSIQKEVYTVDFIDKALIIDTQNPLVLWYYAYNIVDPQQNWLALAFYDENKHFVYRWTAINPDELNSYGNNLITISYLATKYPVIQTYLNNDSIKFVKISMRTYGCDTWIGLKHSFLYNAVSAGIPKIHYWNLYYQVNDGFVTGEQDENNDWWITVKLPSDIWLLSSKNDKIIKLDKRTLTWKKGASTRWYTILFNLDNNELKAIPLSAYPYRQSDLTTILECKDWLWIGDVFFTSESRKVSWHGIPMADTPVNHAPCGISLGGTELNSFPIINFIEKTITFPTGTALISDGRRGFYAYHDGKTSSQNILRGDFENLSCSWANLGNVTNVEIRFNPLDQKLTAYNYSFLHNLGADITGFNDNYSESLLVAVINVKNKKVSISVPWLDENGYLFGIDLNNYVNPVSIDESLISYNTLIAGVNHRGWYECPENTLIAYKESKKHGYTKVETDVSFTSDGFPVCLHDNTINRTARNADGTAISKTININNITFEAVREYDFGIYKGSAYAKEKIPSFEEFILLCRNLGLHPYIELKNSATYTEAQIQSIVNIVKKYGMLRKCSWISFNLTYLEYVKDYDEGARVGYLTGLTAANIASTQTLSTGKNEIFIDTSSYNDTEGINRAIASGIPVEVWTIDSDDIVANLNPYISGVTTNKVRVDKVLYEKGLNTSTIIS